MHPSVLSHPGPLAVDLNQPGTYLHWSIFEISVANLVVIAVMVVIFAAALLLPFPKGRLRPPAPADAAAGAAVPGRDITPPADDEDSRMWTARVRRRALWVLPPEKLLPDRQPAYVSSWMYVFGVASLAALGVAIGSGLAIAIGGVDLMRAQLDTETLLGAIGMKNATRAVGGRADRDPGGQVQAGYRHRGDRPVPPSAAGHLRAGAGGRTRRTRDFIPSA